MSENNHKSNFSFFKEELEKSGISEDTAVACGWYETADKAHIAEILNRDITRVPRGPYLVIPYYDLEDRTKIITYNVKSAEPIMVDGKPQKYLRPTGDKNHLYIPPIISLRDLMDTSKPIMFTEGEKKTLCANIFNKGSITIGLNGIWNWKTKDEDLVSKSLDVFQKIPLKDRKTSICFDSDIMRNSDISNAENQLVELLQSLGSSVRVIRIPDGEKKYGIDDYIMEFGFEEFQHLCREAGLPSKTPIPEIEKYISGIKGLPTAEISNRVRSVRVAVVSKKKEEVSLLVDKIKKESGLSKQEVKDLIESAKPNYNQKKTTTTGKPVLHHDTKRHNQDDLINKVVRVYREKGRVYKMGNEVCVFRFNTREPIDRTNFGGVLVDHANVLWDDRYIPVPEGMVSTILQSSEFLTAFKEATLYTTTTTYDHDWNQVKPGFNDSSKIFYDGKPIAPLYDNSLMEELVAEYCFKNNASKHNFFGALLTTVLRHKWIGRKPFFAITGNQPGLGKTQLAQLAVVIATGKNPPSFTYPDSEAEFEKRIGSQIEQTDILNVDNVRSSKPIDSKSLEMLITATEPSFRRLGKSENIQRTNTITTFMSLNNAMFSPDLLTRMCPIELYLEGPAHKRKFSNTELVEWAFRHRDELCATLIGWIENWKSAGMPTASVDCRFASWANIIGGILKVNGYGEFMTNFESAKAQYTKENLEAGELFNNHLNEYLTLEEIVEKAEKYHLFREALGKPNPKNAMGSVLSSMMGANLPLPSGGTFSLVKGKHPKSRVACYQAVSDTAKKDTEEKIDFNEEDSHE